MGIIKVGSCGWSYLNAEKYVPRWKDKFKSKLQVYAKLFDLVEINSTFYRIPKLSTARKWREEADEVNEGFEFTVKVSQLITHKDPFGKQSLWAFERMKEIARELRAKILLFQSPASFKPTEDNLEKARGFFEKIDRDDFVLVWEVRWAKDWTKEIVRSVFSELGLNQCIDPFRQECFYANSVIYYRLHGFGKPSMYNYGFSEEELKTLANNVRQQKKPVYVLFNNASCYEDGLVLKRLLFGSQKSST